MDLIDYTLKELCKIDKKTKLNAIEILNKSIVIDEFFNDVDKKYEEVRFRKTKMENCCENCKYYYAKDGECPCKSCFSGDMFTENEKGVDYMVEEED